MPEPILSRIARGDEAAVRECISRYGGLVWSLARRACPSAAEAEDLVQEVFIELWRCADRFDPALAAEATFVAMITRRRLIDQGRRAKRRPEHGALPLDVSADLAPPGLQAEIREEAERAQRAFEQLRDEQKLVLKLSIQDGLTHEQIARETGLPLGSVKTHARRGLIRVRELLSGRATGRPKGVLETEVAHEC